MKDGDWGAMNKTCPGQTMNLAQGKDKIGLRGRNSHLKEPRGGDFEGLVVLNMSVIFRKGHLGAQDSRAQGTLLWCGEE